MDGISEIRAQFDKIKIELIKRDGVMGVDIGFKIKENDKTVLKDTLAIRVHVEKKKDAADLRPIDLLNDEINGIPIDVIQANLSPQEFPEFAPSQERTKRREPLIGGISLGGVNKNYGTLGMIVFDKETGEPMVLSNAHVICDNKKHPTLGTDVYQPGIFHSDAVDESEYEDYKIGTISRTGAENGIDCAAAKITNREVSNTILRFGRINGAAPPRLGMEVMKSGVKTDVTYGIIDGINWTGFIDNEAKSTNEITMDAIHIIPKMGLDIKEEISYKGDSGSIWVSRNNFAVGLHFAGEMYENPIEFALAYPINAVLNLLNVSILPIAV